MKSGVQQQPVALYQRFAVWQGGSFANIQRPAGRWVQTDYHKCYTLFSGHPFVITSTKSKEQQQPSNIYTFCCTASDRFCFTSEAGDGGSQLPRMLPVYISRLSAWCVSPLAILPGALCIKNIVHYVFASPSILLFFSLNHFTLSKVSHIRNDSHLDFFLLTSMVLEFDQEP